MSVLWRIGDYYLNRATSWEEIRSAHRKFVHDYNVQIHFVHHERKDDRHSPKAVLRGMLARTIPESMLACIFFATQFTRYLDRSGYIRFRRWHFYAEAGLAKKPVTVHIYIGTLKVEYQDTDLALYTVAWHEGQKQITEVTNPRMIETGHRSPQLTLWTPGPDEWLLFKRLPDYTPRTKRRKPEPAGSSPASRCR
jgi:hypothetical protein